MEEIHDCLISKLDDANKVRVDPMLTSVYFNQVNSVSSSVGSKVKLKYTKCNRVAD